MLLYMVMTYYTIWRLTLLVTYERDTYISVNVQSPLDNRPPMYLKGSDLDFTIQVVNSEYDNDDNPYGEIKLHLYSTMNEENTQEDIIIPMTTDCRGQFNEENVWSTNVNMYCPLYSDEHYLKNDYFHTKS